MAENHNQNKSCYRCGEMGHERKNCPEPKPVDETVDDMCWACGKRGHYTKHCRQPEIPNGNDNSYNRFTSCWNCRGSDHKRSDCTNRQILFCSYCGRSGRTTQACRCNQLGPHRTSRNPNNSGNKPFDKGENKPRGTTPEKKGDQGNEPENRPKIPSAANTATQRNGNKPENSPKSHSSLGTKTNGRGKSLVRCLLEVTINGIQYEATVENHSAISRINPLSVCLTGAKYLAGSRNRWVGVDVTIGDDTIHLVFQVDENLDGEITLGTDAQLTMDFDVTVAGRSIHNPRVLPEIVRQQPIYPESRPIEEDSRFEEILSDHNRPSTSRAAGIAAPKQRRIVKRSSRYHPSSDSDSSVDNSYGRYQRDRRN